MRQAIDAGEFRAALGTFATGVTIVTAATADRGDAGVTANSFNSVSLDPPMVLWSLARKSKSLPVFAAASHFAVHILAADQEELSNRFAQGRSADKFAGLALDRGAGGAPLLAGTAALFECRTAYRYDGGDHVIFVGEVERFERCDRPPLLFHSGRYALAARRAADLAQAAAMGNPEGFGEDFLGELLGRAQCRLQQRLRPALERLGLGLDDHFALSALANAGPATAEQIDSLMGYGGLRFASAGRAMTEHGLATATDGRFELTDLGRRKWLQAAAAAKAIEDEMLEPLDPSEADLLRHLLRRVVHERAFGKR